MDIHDIYLAGGCFWGTEAYLRKLPGVIETQVGYANGKLAAPTYEEVCTGKTGAVECVAVRYDADIISLPLLLEAYFRTIDPTSLNRQGNDFGPQYRTGIYWVDPADEVDIARARAHAARNHSRPIVVEAQPLQSFYPAEEMHQNYLIKNPQGYCHVNLADADKFIVEHEQELLPDTLAQKIAAREYSVPDVEDLLEYLGPETYVVTQHGGTERAWSSPLDSLFDLGIYVDAVTGEPLFLSRDKFASGCGWPSFARPIDESVVELRDDKSIPNMPRTEVVSHSGKSHLGHVFDDGPQELGGKRFCINGAALRFIPADKMEQEGYGYLREVL